jgi:hypothetical protein
VRVELEGGVEAEVEEDVEVGLKDFCLCWQDERTRQMHDCCEWVQIPPALECWQGQLV